ncbi:hypothetical protein [Salinispora arenicola]|uniref:hypothetical protein n=1 Tax=Salinispora arenicola TaxID=168697 RepID=UPI0027DD15B4|nr:hypothetical protein [Salinispora arenicola]
MADAPKQQLRYPTPNWLNSSLLNTSATMRPQPRMSTATADSSAIESNVLMR